MKQFLLFLLIFASPILGNAQQKQQALTISLFNEATALPFTRFITSPLHPGMLVGTEFNYRTKKHTRLFQTANISYFYHRQLNQGIGLMTELGYEYRSNPGIAVTSLLGIGYLHSFVTKEEFTFKNGQYFKKADRGNARFVPSLSVDLGYYLQHKNRFSPKIFFRYQAWAEYPYSPGFIPVMLHINVHAGITLFLHKKNKPLEN